MDEQTKPPYDPHIINCDDIPDRISLATNPKKNKKVKKTKTCKRIIDLYNMDNLIITRKLKMKKQKFKCVINIKTMCESETSDIVRSAYNVCKKEAYYQRIVPICLRKMCSAEGDISKCCRSTLSREFKEYRKPKVESLSPVSSVALTEVCAANNISYEDVSNGSFSSGLEESEDELDTLIKRTKQRERLIRHSYPLRENTSSPLSKVDYAPASPYSIDTDKKSIHSDTTMVLRPLSSEAYSPIASFDIKKENIEETLIDNLPYSPTMTPDLIKMEMDYSPVRTDDDNIPHSPTFTPENIKIDDPAINNSNYMNATTILQSVFIKEEKDYMTSNSNDGNDESYPSCITPDIIKMGNPNRVQSTNMYDVNASYTDFHKYTINRHMSTGNNPYECSTSTIKQENLDDESTISCANIPTYSAVLAKDLITRETYKDYNNLYSTETDYNMNNTNNYKNESVDCQRWGIRDANTTGIVTKIVREEDTNVDLGDPMLQNNVIIKTEDIY